jgi:starch-binding outer membrane protein, SusD/RagB family
VQSIEDLKNTAFSAQRSTFTQCAEYIISECDFITNGHLLPLLDEGADQGRPNGTAAKALKCKTFTVACQSGLQHLILLKVLQLRKLIGKR